jgi:hypothetical protein
MKQHGMACDGCRELAYLRRAEAAELEVDRLQDVLATRNAEVDGLTALLAAERDGDTSGAPPLDQDPIAIHFAQHRSGPVEGCRLCDDATARLLQTVLSVGDADDPEKETA